MVKEAEVDQIESNEVFETEFHVCSFTFDYRMCYFGIGHLSLIDIFAEGNTKRSDADTAKGERNSDRDFLFERGFQERQYGESILDDYPGRSKSECAGAVLQ